MIINFFRSICYLKTAIPMRKNYVLYVRTARNFWHYFKSKIYRNPIYSYNNYLGKQNVIIFSGSSIKSIMSLHENVKKITQFFD